MAGFPSIKTLDDFDFEFAAGMPKMQEQELASLSNVLKILYCLGHRALAKPILQPHWVIRPLKQI